MNCSVGVVYSNTWTGQTSGIGSAGSPVTVYTATQNTFLRISVAGAVTANFSAATVAVEVKASGHQMIGSSFTTNEPQGVVTTEILNGDTVTFWTTVSSGTPTYDFAVVIEQLI